MDIQALSMTMSQSRLQEEAAVSVQVMAIGNAREQAADLSRLMETAQVITDPARGNYLDLEM